MQPIPNILLGGCICRALRYRITGEPLTLYTCHCTDCQRQGGSAFGMSMTLLKTQFELLSGTPRVFTKTFPDDGRQKFTHFCGDCGTRLWTDFTKSTHVINVRPGTLDDTLAHADRTHLDGKRATLGDDPGLPAQLPGPTRRHDAIRASLARPRTSCGER